MSLRNPAIDGPRLEPSRQGHARSASRSPRRLLRTQSPNFDDFYRDLSPSKTLRAIVGSSDPTSSIPRDEEKLMQSIESASDKEKAFAQQVAETSKLLKQLLHELEQWPWYGNFEAEDDSPEALLPVVDSTALSNPPPSERRPIKPYLSPELTSEYEKRLEEVKDDLDSLDIEELKAHVRRMYNLDKHSVPSESDIQLENQVSQQSDGLTALVTVTILQGLRFRTQLLDLIVAWTARLAVLADVPSLSHQFMKLNIAMRKANDLISETNTETLIANEVEAEFPTPGIFSHTVNSTWTSLKSDVSSLGGRIDQMLDVLEGRPETLPEVWIDLVEHYEVNFNEWTHKARVRVEAVDAAVNVTRHRAEQLKKATFLPSQDEPEALGHSDHAVEAEGRDVERVSVSQQGAVEKFDEESHESIEPESGFGMSEKPHNSNSDERCLARDLESSLQSAASENQNCGTSVSLERPQLPEDGPKKDLEVNSSVQSLATGSGDYMNPLDSGAEVQPMDMDFETKDDVFRKDIAHEALTSETNVHATVDAIDIPLDAAFREEKQFETSTHARPIVSEQSSLSAGGLKASIIEETGTSALDANVKSKQQQIQGPPQEAEEEEEGGEEASADIDANALIHPIQLEIASELTNDGLPPNFSVLEEKIAFGPVSTAHDRMMPNLEPEQKVEASVTDEIQVTSAPEDQNTFEAIDSTEGLEPHEPKKDEAPAPVPIIEPIGNPEVHAPREEWTDIIDAISGNLPGEQADLQSSFDLASPTEHQTKETGSRNSNIELPPDNRIDEAISKGLDHVDARYSSEQPESGQRPDPTLLAQDLIREPGDRNSNITVLREQETNNNAGETEHLHIAPSKEQPKVQLSSDVVQVTYHLTDPIGAEHSYEEKNHGMPPDLLPANNMTERGTEILEIPHASDDYYQQTMSPEVSYSPELDALQNKGEQGRPDNASELKLLLNRQASPTYREVSVHTQENLQNFNESPHDGQEIPLRLTATTSMEETAVSTPLTENEIDRATIHLNQKMHHVEEQPARTTLPTQPEPTSQLSPDLSASLPVAELSSNIEDNLKKDSITVTGESDKIGTAENSWQGDPQITMYSPFRETSLADNARIVPGHSRDVSKDTQISQLSGSITWSAGSGRSSPEIQDASTAQVIRPTEVLTAPPTDHAWSRYLLANRQYFRSKSDSILRILSSNGIDDSAVELSSTTSPDLTGADGSPTNASAASIKLTPGADSYESASVSNGKPLRFTPNLMHSEIIEMPLRRRYSDLDLPKSFDQHISSQVIADKQNEAHAAFAELDSAEISKMPDTTDALKEAESEAVTENYSASTENEPSSTAPILELREDSIEDPHPFRNTRRLSFSDNEASGFPDFTGFANQDPDEALPSIETNVEVLPQISTPDTEFDGDEYMSSPQSPRSQRSRSSTASSDMQLDQQIDKILTSIPRIHFDKSHIAKYQGRPLRTPPPNAPARTADSPSPVKSQASSSPSFLTLFAASKPEARASRSNYDSAIRVYHLSVPGRSIPIKLFVRRVGENGERVMVRVGGGWADLGDYLREYAAHHSRLVTPDRTQPISKERLSLPSGISEMPKTSSTPNLSSPLLVPKRGSKQPGPSNIKTTPRSASALGVHKSVTFANQTSSLYPRSKTPTVDGRSRTPTMRHGISPTPPLNSSSSTGGKENNKKLIVEHSESSPSLLGPSIGRRTELTPEKKKWLDDMVARAKQWKMNKNAGLPDGLEEIGTVGSTRRVFSVGSLSTSSSSGTTSAATVSTTANNGNSSSANSSNNITR